MHKLFLFHFSFFSFFLFFLVLASCILLRTNRSLHRRATFSTPSTCRSICTPTFYRLSMLWGALHVAKRRRNSRGAVLWARRRHRCRSRSRTSALYRSWISSLTQWRALNSTELPSLELCATRAGRVARTIRRTHRFVFSSVRCALLVL